MSKRVKKFLREIGVEPAQSTSRNPMESPPALSDSVGWSLGEEEFARRVGSRNLTGLGDLLGLWREAREETLSVTEEAGRVESEIDERVKNLYGL